MAGGARVNPHPKKPKLEEGVEEFSLYNGEIKLLYKDSSHRYRISENGGKPFQVPSVTTILNVLNKPMLVPWAVGVTVDFIRAELDRIFSGSSVEIDKVFAVVDSAREAHDLVKQEAADIGSSAHDWLENYWKSVVQKTDSPPVPEDEKVRNCVDAALKWIAEHEFKPLLVERPFYSRKYQITGKEDLAAIVDGKLAIVDYKSGKAIYPETALQSAAYAKMYEEEFGQPVEVRWAIHLGKHDGEFATKKYPKETEDLDFDSFLCAFRLYDRLKHLRRAEKPDFFADLEIA